MKLGLLAAVPAFALALASVPSHANIDTTGSFFGTFAGVGIYPNGQHMSIGEVFVPQADQQHLTSFTLYLSNRAAGSGTLDLRGYFATWDGQKPADILYQSPTQTMNAAGDLQAFHFTTDILLNPGDPYIVYLSAADLPTQPASAFAMPYGSANASDRIAFTFYDTNTNQYAWNADNLATVWFQATFAEVPEPASLAVLGFGMAALGWVRRRPA